jgi:hypothetical protein
MHPPTLGLALAPLLESAAKAMLPSSNNYQLLHRGAAEERAAENQQD